MKTVVVIPARLESTRLPNKVILDIGGKPLIQRVFEQVKKSKKVSDIFIATDSEKIIKLVESFGGKAILTSSKHQSGTDRIAEAVQNLETDFIINVQGDEPLISPNLIDSLISVLENDDEVSFVSAMRKIDNLEDLDNPNCVKVITDFSQNAIYFSRSKIPFSRDNDFQNYFQHIGIYGYKKDFLLKYSQLPQTVLEQTEKLEQLRAIENGFKIRMVETEYKSIGVDTLADLEKVRQIWKS